MHLYGGDYDFYIRQKQIEQEAALHQYQTATREWHKSVHQQQQAIERQGKRNRSALHSWARTAWPFWATTARANPRWSN
jgi:ATPase subunit of ABC transporter with duplicated ATPase domains